MPKSLAPAFPMAESPYPTRSHALELSAMPYGLMWDRQKRLHAARKEKKLNRDVYILLEHEPVFTLGRRGGEENLKVDRAFLERSGVPVFPVERGGDITFHGPGQLMAYAIVRLPERGWKVGDFVHLLEETMIRIAADFGVTAQRDDRNRGVWKGDAKLGALGISVRGGTSFHGFALNVNTDLAYFDWINPCGLLGVGVSSLARETGASLDMAKVKERAWAHIRELFETELDPTGWPELEKAAT